MLFEAETCGNCAAHVGHFDRTSFILCLAAVISLPCPIAMRQKVRTPTPTSNEPRQFRTESNLPRATLLRNIERYQVPSDADDCSKNYSAQFNFLCSGLAGS